MLKILPDTPERARQELALHVALGAPIRITKGYGAQEVEQTYIRARELCQQLGDASQLFPVLWGLWYFYFSQAKYHAAQELGEQCLTLAHEIQDPAFLMEAHLAMGAVLLVRGEFISTRKHYEQAVSLYDPRLHRPLAFIYGQDPKVSSLSPLAWALWELGYPGQALKRSYEALSLAQDLSHPYSLAFALGFAAWIHQYRREEHLAQERAEAAMDLSNTQGVPLWLSWGAITKGWALVEQGLVKQGIEHIRQGTVTLQAMGAELQRSYFLALLAEANGKAGCTEEGLQIITEALAHVDNTGERYYEAELHRLKGELTLQKGTRDWKPEIGSSSPSAPSLKPQVSSGVAREAEGCFLTAIEVARKQQAKSLELRAVMSLAKLWQRQGKQKEAHRMLSEVYNWFTEGFDTKDLQEAKALLDELAGAR